MTPAEVIHRSIEMFIFSGFLQDAIDQELITKESFPQRIFLDDEKKGGISFDLPLNQDRLRRYADQFVSMAIGTTALATSKALEVLYGHPKPNDTSPDGSMRVLLYQIRCAFAHDPLNPIWTPKVGQYRHRYEFVISMKSGPNETLASRKIEFHPPSLEAKSLAPEHFGGIEAYVWILHHFLALVKAHPRGNEPYTPPVEEPREES